MTSPLAIGARASLALGLCACSMHEPAARDAGHADGPVDAAERVDAPPPPPAPTPAMLAVADWIASLQYRDRALPSYGAVRRHHTPGLRVGGTAYHRVLPYSASLGVLGLLSAPVEGKLAVAEAWIEWYLAHLEPGGSPPGRVLDHWYTESGGGETTCPDPTDAATCDAEDSSDAYAATLLMVAWSYRQHGGSDAFLRARREALERVADVVLALQDADGLTWAKSTWRVKYTMDNAEVAAGLRAMARLEAEVYGDPSRAALYETAADRAAAAIRAELYDAALGLYVVAKFEDGATPPPDLSRWYPDSTALAWPGLFGVTSADDPVARAQMMAIGARWDWAGRAVDPDGFLWPSIALAALGAGDEASARTHADHVVAARVPGFGWPFGVDDGGWLLRLLVGLSEP